MKKLRILAAAIAALAVGVIIAQAAAPVRTEIAVTTSALSTNDAVRVPLLPVRFDVYGWTPAADTVTVQRIRGVRTNTVVSFTTSGGAGNASGFATNYLYLIAGDVTRITSTGTGTGTVEMVSLCQE